MVNKPVTLTKTGAGVTKTLSDKVILQINVHHREGLNKQNDTNRYVVVEILRLFKGKYSISL